VRVYHFVDAEHGEENIKKQRLKACRFLDLNDPFELMAGEQSDPIFRKRLKDWVSKIDQELGLLCFSLCWRNPLMWTHYSKRHTGVCLGFDVNDSIVEPIDYSRRRLSLVEWKGASPPGELKKALLTTKFADWIYEKERRVILPLAQLNKEGSLFFKPFDPTLRLVEVIAGPKCAIECRLGITDAIKALPAKPRLIKARLAFRKFEVTTQKHQDSSVRGFESDSYWQK
jgi:hypothetical protein